MTEKHPVMTLMVTKFQQRHGRSPSKIVVAPLALVALGVKKSVAAEWHGMPVECRLFQQEEVASPREKDKVVALGIFVKTKRGKLILRACDLKLRAA